MACGPRSLTLEAQTGSLHEVMEFVRQGALEASLPSVRLDELDLVIEEIYVNVCRHAYPPNGPRMASITYWVPSPGELQVEVADQGVEFNPLDFDSPDTGLDLEDRPIGGLGIFLVKQLTGSLSYRREDGWNRLTFGMSAES